MHSSDNHLRFMLWKSIAYPTKTTETGSYSLAEVSHVFLWWVFSIKTSQCKILFALPHLHFVPGTCKATFLPLSQLQPWCYFISLSCDIETARETAWWGFFLILVKTHCSFWLSNLEIVCRNNTQHLWLYFRRMKFEIENLHRVFHCLFGGDESYSDPVFHPKGVQNCLQISIRLVSRDFSLVRLMLNPIL